MKKSFIFVAQGKQKDYPGKNTIMDALDEGETVELTFFADKDQIIIINHIGEISGCFPSQNPATKADYRYLRDNLDVGSQVSAIAIPHNVFNYGVQVTITT